MKIERQIAQRHWVAAAEEQLAKDYRERGYNVDVRSKLGEFEADIVARKGNELIVIEVKTTGRVASRAKEATALRNYVVKKLGGEFNVYIVTPPNDVTIQIDGIEQLLLDFLMESPGDLEELATHVSIEEVDGIDIKSVHAKANGLRVEGSGTVYVELQYGSNSDNKKGDGARSSDSYPFTFDVVLDHDLSAQQTANVSVDTSSFYE